MSDFVSSFKSTIDKLGFDVATNLSLQFIDLDDLAKADSLFHGTRDALVWEFLGFSPAPTEPLYDFGFKIGARTVNDAANYGILKIIDDIREVFPVNVRHPIRNYVGEVAGPEVGYMIVSDIRVDPQMYDKQSGIRMILVTGKCVDTSG